jgi:hypothetical protein
MKESPLRGFVERPYLKTTNKLDQLLGAFRQTCTAVRNSMIRKSLLFISTRSTRIRRTKSSAGKGGGTKELFLFTEAKPGTGEEPVNTIQRRNPDLSHNLFYPPRPGHAPGSTCLEAIGL